MSCREKQNSPLLIGDTPNNRIFRFRCQSKHHDAAAQHYEEAARHRRQAAKLSDSASRDKASHHAHPVYAHHLHAERQAEESAQADIKNHLEDSR